MGLWQQGTVFDYYVDEASCSMARWEARVPAFTHQPENFGAMFVPTVDTTRLTFLLELLASRNHHVMLIGNTGEPARIPRRGFAGSCFAQAGTGAERARTPGWRGIS